MTGHTSWNALRDRIYAERPGMAERVAALRASDPMAGVDGESREGESWEIELEAEIGGDAISPESIREKLVDAVEGRVEVLEADVEVRSDHGRSLLFAVLVIALGAGVGLIAREQFARAGEAADLVRLRLEDYGSIVAQSVRQAA